MPKITHVLLPAGTDRVLVDTRARLLDYVSYVKDGYVELKVGAKWQDIFDMLSTDKVIIWNGNAHLPFKEAQSLVQDGLTNDSIVFGVRYSDRSLVQMNRGKLSYYVGKVRSKVKCLVDNIPLSDSLPPCFLVGTSTLQSSLKSCSDLIASYECDIINKLCNTNKRIKTIPIMWRDI